MTFTSPQHLIRLLRKAFPAPHAIHTTNGLEWRSRVELRLIKASAYIRASPEWVAVWQQNNGPLEQWAVDIAEQFELTERDVAYVLAELEYYVVLQTKAAANITHSSVDMVWTAAKSFAKNELAENLNHHSKALEHSLRRDKAWARHYLEQSCNEKTARTVVLLDPSLYPLMYDTSQVLAQPIDSLEDALNLSTRGVAPKSFEQWVEAVTAINDTMDRLAIVNSHREIDIDIMVPTCCDSQQWPQPKHGCWLPTEFAIDSDGIARALSYINNLHPVWHTAMYTYIEQAFTMFVPLLEQVLTDLVHLRELRVPVDVTKCVTFDSPHPEELDLGLRRFYLPIETSMTWDEWAEGIEYTEPEPTPFVMPRRPFTPYALRNTCVQAAVKMSTIEIPQGCSEYSECMWQAAGNDECIIATGVYFYDVTNIDHIEMQFRESVKCSVECSGNKKEALRLVYGDGQRNHTHGMYKYPNVPRSLNITNAKLVCIPNIYQHKIMLRLKDAADSGHVKMLVFYFVNPAARILSTKVVPPQQQSWWAERVFSTLPLCSLPYEIVENILKYVTLPVSFDEACKRRNLFEAKHFATN
ncbi:hypothetical protein IW139_001497 [Coemansia sp. RSA 353]|nr:hypothetical protein EV181_001476 [Coemansia sp. RSA 532]KAJ2247368.1 hypothetical protein GGH97_002143 [Coemansia sp. RSA 475]KAJ2278542.1 hypothetical protein EV176_001767 [Coemansia sp. RSA 451]KAJ2290627.1 hypothetical protein IW141_003154 [Coemansia sp. RSA 355]KAJ2299813.1 hypothetical protein IW139_001497 [Coemansia sp. RSA 353]KAJ2532269.1 hypothetical protein GGH20_001192 [Coemansia sp. RSA 1937]